MISKITLENAQKFRDLDQFEMCPVLIKTKSLSSRAFMLGLDSNGKMGLLLPSGDRVWIETSTIVSIQKVEYPLGSNYRFPAWPCHHCMNGTGIVRAGPPGEAPSEDDPEDMYSICSCGGEGRIYDGLYRVKGLNEKTIEKKGKWVFHSDRSGMPDIHVEYESREEMDNDQMRGELNYLGENYADAEGEELSSRLESIEINIFKGGKLVPFDSKRCEFCNKLIPATQGACKDCLMEKVYVHLADSREYVKCNLQYSQVQKVTKLMVATTCPCCIYNFEQYSRTN